MIHFSKHLQPFFFLTAILALGLVTSCGQQQKEQEKQEEPKDVGETLQKNDMELVYEVPISGMNEKVNGGRSVSGMAKFVLNNGELTISVEAEGLEPNMMHLQHLHGMEDLGIANCPNGLEDDMNNDGILDLLETRESAGITMIPLHDNPTSLQIKTETYPKSDANGKLKYEQTVDFTMLMEAYNKKFGLDTLNLNQHVIFLHGVSPDAELPESVQSLPEVPAHVTLPVACGALNDTDT